MSKLEKEIAMNNAAVSVNNTEKSKDGKDKNELVESILDSVSGGWINAFARFDKNIDW